MGLDQTAYITKEALPDDPAGDIAFWTDHWEKTHPDAEWAKWPEEDKVGKILAHRSTTGASILTCTAR